jgi:hypothetical protein
MDIETEVEMPTDALDLILETDATNQNSIDEIEIEIDSQDAELMLNKVHSELNQQPEIQDLQGYWDLVLGRTAPVSLAQPREPSYVGEPSSAPLESMDSIDNMYLQPERSASGMLYQQVPPNFLDQQFKPVDFGKSRNRRRNIRR